MNDEPRSEIVASCLVWSRIDDSCCRLPVPRVFNPWLAVLGEICVRVRTPTGWKPVAREDSHRSRGHDVGASTRLTRTGILLPHCIAKARFCIIGRLRDAA